MKSLFYSWVFFNSVLATLYSIAASVNQAGGMENEITPSEVSEPSPESVLPFVVSIQVHGWHQCGGCVIKKNVILTACHCLGRMGRRGIRYWDASKVKVVAGSKSTSVKQTVFASKLTAHPGCTLDSLGLIVNDVGLIELGTSLTFNRDIMPVKLFSFQPERSLAKLKKFQLQNSECTTGVWGASTINKTPNSSEVCMMHLRSPVECRWLLCPLLKAYCTYRFYLKGQMCAVPTDGTCLPCPGDDGGPLICKGYLYGLISFNSLCDSRYPAVFTNTKPILFMLKRIIDSKPRSMTESTRSRAQATIDMANILLMPLSIFHISAVVYS